MKKKPKTYTYAEAIARAKADPTVRIAHSSWDSLFWFRWDGQQIVNEKGAPESAQPHEVGGRWRVWRMVPRPTRAELRAVEAERDAAQRDVSSWIGILKEQATEIMQSWVERALKAEVAHDKAIAECTRLRERVAELEARGHYPLLDLLRANPGRTVRNETGLPYKAPDAPHGHPENMRGEDWSPSLASLTATDWQLVDEPKAEPASPWVDCTARKARRKWLAGLPVRLASGETVPPFTVGKSTLTTTLLWDADQTTGWQWAPAT